MNTKVGVNAEAIFKRKRRRGKKEKRNERTNKKEAQIHIHTCVYYLARLNKIAGLLRSTLNTIFYKANETLSLMKSKKKMVYSRLYK